MHFAIASSIFGKNLENQQVNIYCISIAYCVIVESKRRSAKSDSSSRDRSLKNMDMVSISGQVNLLHYNLIFPVNKHASSSESSSSSSAVVSSKRSTNNDSTNTIKPPAVELDALSRCAFPNKKQQLVWYCESCCVFHCLTSSNILCPFKTKHGFK